MIIFNNIVTEHTYRPVQAVFGLWYSKVTMNVLVLYRPNTEYRSAVDEFVRSFQQRAADAYKIELLSVDTREGSVKAQLYDVMQFPAVLVVDDQGLMQQMWVGENLPLIDEVIAYSRA